MFGIRSLPTYKNRSTINTKMLSLSGYFPSHLNTSLSAGSRTKNILRIPFTKRLPKETTNVTHTILHMIHKHTETHFYTLLVIRFLPSFFLPFCCIEKKTRGSRNLHCTIFPKSLLPGILLQCIFATVPAKSC